MTSSQQKASLRRQRMLEFLGDRLVTSQASKVPASQAHLLPEEDRHLAGSRERKKIKEDARRKILPDFLRRRLTRWRTILKLKLLARSLKVSSSSFWWLRLITLRMLVTSSSAKGSKSQRLRGWLTRLVSQKRSENSSAPSSSASGENTSGTNTFFRKRPSREFTSCNTCSATGSPWRRPKK
jgi:hypothetical protein